MQENLKLIKLQNNEDKEIMKDIPYANAISSLIYTTTCTRFDTTFVVNKATQFMANPNITHWSMIKRIFCYSQFINNNYGILYNRPNTTFSLEGWSDADWTSDSKSSKSTTGYIFTLGGSMIDWQ